jgi:hypothetical protein
MRSSCWFRWLLCESNPPSSTESTRVPMRASMTAAAARSELPNSSCGYSAFGL